MTLRPCIEPKCSRLTNRTRCSRHWGRIDWALGRKMWDEGEELMAIGEALRCTDTSIYRQAKKEKWPTRPTGWWTPSELAKATGLSSGRILQLIAVGEKGPRQIWARKIRSLWYISPDSAAKEIARSRSVGER